MCVLDALQTKLWGRIRTESSSAEKQEWKDAGSSLLAETPQNVNETRAISVMTVVGTGQVWRPRSWLHWLWPRGHGSSPVRPDVLIAEG